MINKLAIILLIAFLPFGICGAHESERIDKIEKELEELREQLGLALFMLMASDASEQNDETVSESSAAEKWQSLENWRKLQIGMEPNEVREILGEPKRVDGGDFFSWYYQNSGRVVFHDGALWQWQEPLFF